MKDRAKIQLSQLERELVTDTNWILTKNGLLQKIRSLLGRIIAEQATIIHSLPAPLPVTSAKISRGENYQGLPYLVLDYPRHFDQENMLLMRTFFWWGNFFSVTLQLAGSFKEMYTTGIGHAYDRLKETGYFICINEDPWQHHFEQDNYSPIHSFTKEEFTAILQQQAFIKISRKIPLGDWDNTEELLTGMFRQLIQLLAIEQTNRPGGEKDPSPGDPREGFGL